MSGNSQIVKLGTAEAVIGLTGVSIAASEVAAVVLATGGAVAVVLAAAAIIDALVGDDKRQQLPRPR